MTDPTAIVAYLALFVGIGVAFLLVNLLVGKFLRPDLPNEEKLEIYECGEPTIGSSFVQFDLRFYVVALIFLVFDAEVAFFFPAATVFGKGTELTRPGYEVVETSEAGDTVLTASATKLYRELGVQNPATVVTADEAQIRADANTFALFALVAIMIFFWVLVFGFAYEWKTGALDWVRSVPEEPAEITRRAPPSLSEEQMQPTPA
ncbi:MAG: NADH-quinone oxidoreductase subunit A [Pirellulales bacterium]|nr:NADH-quinone oxidoreductase subunit A [Pirellulales bacterium]